MPTGAEDFDDALHERLLAWDRKIQADREAAVARFNRNPFRLARRANVLRHRIAEENRQIARMAQRAKAVQTMAERQEIYAERGKVKQQFTNRLVRRAMALTLRRQGKSYREIGEVVGCGGDRAKQLVAQAERDEERKRREERRALDR